jgi:transaldolase
MITTGGLANMIEADDLRGITSNPSIFDKAISSTHEYDDILKRELRERPDQSSRELFFALAIEDIRDGADILRPVYDATGGQDGMISLEVSPDLAHDPAGTVREARELWERLSRPNLMVKVPATAACVPVIEQLIYEGLNINVTLLFSLERYKAVADAYTRGLERRLEQGQSVERIASVASFFISRVDSAMDPLLADKRPEWQGKVAIANAKLAYQHYKAFSATDRCAKLKAAGALPQRLLWASTSTKNPDYPELVYVEELIGPETVNTMPPATYEAFREYGTVAATLETGLEEAQAQVAGLSDLGIDLKEVTDRLESEGVAIFAKSFDNLLHHIGNKAKSVAA